MTTVIEQMLEAYDIKSIEDEKNAIKEILQELILCSLAKANFFNDAVFCGGTALRVFYKLNRFSEDLDFSLKVANANFSITKYLEEVTKSLKGYGINVEIKENKNNAEKNVKSAFLKANTIEQLLYFNSSFDIKGIQKDEQTKIKIEIDSNPPQGGTYERKISLVPEIYNVTIYDMSSLFAGKLHSLLCRFWDNRVKGRDLYDFTFYVSRKAKINISFLENAMKQTGNLKEDEKLDYPKIKQLLKERFALIDYKLAKEDVRPFIKNESELDSWNKELFIAITDLIEE
jgi:predicted nucleotidyltransferase component of viral defense system